ncbi:MAG: DinB family protein [Bacteroidia bacterium]|nr:DinB family protein [Bacteroidia bacterium]
MDIHKQIHEIESFLTTTFKQTEEWFNKSVLLREYKPRNNGWSVNEILEHIALTNHYLLILIEKGTNKALKNNDKFNPEEDLKNYAFQKDKLSEVGLHKSFVWIRPEHMEPKGEKTNAMIQEQLKLQLQQCLDSLRLLKNGEGVLSKTNMSVNNLGKIDVYEYVYFLGQHALRHITQMEKVESEFNQMQSKQ